MTGGEDNIKAPLVKADLFAGYRTYAVGDYLR